MTELLEPLTPPDCDLQAFPFMPLHVARLRDSDLAAEEEPEACWYAVLLWAASWHQIPAASLPDNDTVLMRLVGLGRDQKTWNRCRAGALRGFVKCTDGRLYHPVVAEAALESWKGRVSFHAERSAAAERQARWREDQKKLSQRLREKGVTPPEKASKTVLYDLLRQHDPAWLAEFEASRNNEQRNGEGDASVTQPVTPVTPKRGTGTGTGNPPNPPTPPDPRLAEIMCAGGFIQQPTDWKAVLENWISRGADYEQDILPVLRRAGPRLIERSGRAPFKLKVFEPDLVQHMAEAKRDLERLRSIPRQHAEMDRQQREDDQAQESPEAKAAREQAMREYLAANPRPDDGADEEAA